MKLSKITQLALKRFITNLIAHFTDPSALRKMDSPTKNEVFTQRIKSGKGKEPGTGTPVTTALPSRSNPPGTFYTTKRPSMPTNSKSKSEDPSNLKFNLFKRSNDKEQLRKEREARESDPTNPLDPYQ